MADFTAFVRKNAKKRPPPDPLKEYSKRPDRMPRYKKKGYKDTPGGTKYAGQISYDNATNRRKI